MELNATGDNGFSWASGTTVVPGDANGAMTTGIATSIASTTTMQRPVMWNNYLGRTIYTSAGNTTLFSEAQDGTTGSGVSDAGPSITAGTTATLSSIIRSTNVEAFVNGVSSGGATALAHPPRSGSAWADAMLLLWDAATGGKFYALIMVTGPLSSTDHTSMTNYLQSKY